MRAIDADRLNSIKFHPSLYTHITPSDADAESYKRGWNDAIDSIIENAPTIEPERKKGKWPETEEDEYWRMWYVQNAEKHLYMETSVPNCVAEMMEDQDGKGKKSN